MLRQMPRLTAAVAVVALSTTFAADTYAACTRLAFSVNDYGKIGPTNDAKNLLDKYIAKWTADRKIKGYNVGPKEVTCELFLDVGFFDEYTCKAAATVCWNGPLPAGHTTEAGAASPFVGGSGSIAPAAAPRARTPKAAEGAPKGDAPIATGSVKAAPAPAPAPAAAPAARPAPAAASTTGGPPSATRSLVTGAPAPAARPAPAPAAVPASVAPAPAN